MMILLGLKNLAHKNATKETLNCIWDDFFKIINHLTSH